MNALVLESRASRVHSERNLVERTKPEEAPVATTVFAVRVAISLFPQCWFQFLVYLKIVSLFMRLAVSLLGGRKGRLKSD